jgi:hypothetical protein
MKPTLGRIVYVNTDPAVEGQDTAPAIITQVNRDGTVNLRVFCDEADVKLRDVKLVDSEDQAAKDIEDVYETFPGHERDRDGKITKPGINKRTDKEWTRGDVAGWHRVAWWPVVAAPPAPAPAEPAPAAPPVLAPVD